MLTITRGLPWVVNFSVYDDSEHISASNLRGKTYKSQIRGKNAIDGKYPLILDAEVKVSSNVVTLSLSPAETSNIAWGDYLIDVVSTTGEILLPKQAIKAVGHVTLPNEPNGIPNFSQIFLTALND
jgi:hypothetical protein